MPAKPSLELLRSLTDEHVLRALMQARRLTRADLATRTGISKPTVGESVRRLTEAGLLVDTGQRTAGGRGRGRVGSYYALADDIGATLVFSIAPEGVVAECVDVYGDVVSRAEQQIRRPARPAQVAAALRAAATQAQHSAGLPTRLAVVSAADPVDRTTGRLIHLPDAPFLLGQLSPVDVLASHVDVPVIVDNDVNWAAQAEREHGGTGTLDDFAYVFLGEGLGCAVISDGAVRRGHAGIAGEIAHIITAGPQGQATLFTEVFAELGVRRAGSTAVDVERLLSTVAGPDPDAVAMREALGRAIRNPTRRQADQRPKRSLSPSIRRFSAYELSRRSLRPSLAGVPGGWRPADDRRRSPPPHRHSGERKIPADNSDTGVTLTYPNIDVAR